MLRVVSCFALLLTCLIASPAAADIEAERESIEGLRGVKVVVETVDVKAEQHGLSASTIQLKGVP